MMEEHHISVTRRARYFSLGTVNEQLKQVWFVCHGYGQLASDFLKNFEVLANGHRLIIAPEGLSRFYLRGFTGRVGTSWMTREDRLNEIRDYVDYLNAVYNEICKSFDSAGVKIFVLGFSQGTATAWRWVCQGSAKTDHLILWAGFVPPELELAKSQRLFRRCGLTLIIGKHDELGNEQAIIEQERTLKENQIPFKLLRFDGGHELDSQLLSELAKG